MQEGTRGGSVPESEGRRKQFLGDEKKKKGQNRGGKRQASENGQARKRSSEKHRDVWVNEYTRIGKQNRLSDGCKEGPRSQSEPLVRGKCESVLVVAVNGRGMHAVDT